MFEPGLVTPYIFDSKKIEDTVKLGVYLPKNYSPLYKHHVLITFDGQDFSMLGQMHRTYEKLYNAKEIDRAIIIYVHYRNFAQRQRLYHPDSPEKERTIDFVVFELLPWIDKTFSTLKTGTARVLMGDSLAASICLTICLRYPQTFSQAALFSPMVTQSTYKELDTCLNVYALDIYHTIGLQEDSFELISGGNADFLTPNRALHETIEDRTITNYYEELDGGHTWKSWKPQIGKILRYFLSE